MWDGSNTSDDTSSPTSVIVIAVIVGTLISSVCITAVVCLIVRSIRKKKELEEANKLPGENSDEKRRREIRERMGRET
jgi:large-conductance mechanosensitive channel